jgi:tRNA-splicing ligase RtcB (3'-phosphate/5'-hydroxy nucleic acid ligase)
MKVFKKEDYRLPVFNWCSDIEAKTEEQIDHVAKLPFVVEHVSIMPDGHFGFGVPIGTVIACEGVVICSAVGVDIGCGVLSVKTNICNIEIQKVKSIMGEIRKRIPLGFNWNKTQVKELPPLKEDLPVVKSEFSNAKLQLSSLGGGNHFLELQVNSDGYMYFMIHSGSRNLGKKVADHYNKIAKELNARWYSSVPVDWDLAFLPIEEPMGKMYLKEMQYAVEFAQMNRDAMSEQIQESIHVVMGGDVVFEPPINIAHNYAQWENVKGKNVIIHRKGATSARKGELGIIPGSQGTSSYIVRGLGNEQSFNSCSHGAGRRMGRKAAQRDLDLKTEIKRLDDIGVVHGIRHQNDLDEAAGAYKDIEEVMENQKDLVEIVTKLTPIGVVKG